MIPNILHYVQLTNGGREWKLHHYLSVKSASVRSGVQKIYIWLDEEPKGEWWELTRPLVELIKVEPPTEIFGKPIIHPAHKSDVIRLQVLIENGGIYADTDTIFVKSFEPLLKYQFILGQQGVNGREGLCPAIILSQKDSEFAKQWLSGFNEVFQGGPPGSDTWCIHSVDFPMQLAMAIPQHISLAGHELFFWPLYHEPHLEMMFEEVKEFPNAFSHHLWETLSKKYLDTLTIEDIKSNDTTFTRLVKDLV